jgi:hypothetical protein
MSVVRSGTMKHRIAIWAGAGFLVAGFWALFAIATFPSTSERMRDVWTLVCITCPIAIAGMHHAISLYESLVANAVTYGFVGLIVETLRKQLHHAHWIDPATTRSQSPQLVKKRHYTHHFGL